MDSYTETPAPIHQVGATNGTVGEPARPGPRFQLRRSRTDRMISGVCGGLGKALDVDPNLVRIGLVALTIVGVGTGAVLYVAAWLLVPEEDV